VEAALWAVKMVVQQSTGVPSYFACPPAREVGSSLPESPAAAAAAGTLGPTAAAASGGSAVAAAGLLSGTPVHLDAAAMSAIVRCLSTAAAAAASNGAGGSSSAHTDSGSGMLTAVPRSGRPAAIAALAAGLVACCCRRAEERNLAIAGGAPEKLLRLLLGSDRPDTQVAALEGLSLMLPYQPSACALALSCPEIYGRLFTLLRDPAPSVRLLAASCAATLCRMPGCEQTEAMQRAALPVLLRLLTQPATRPHVPAVLASLVEGSEALQKAAADADAVRLLAGLLAAEAVAAEVTTATATTARTTGQAVAAPDVAAAAAVSSGAIPGPAVCAAADGGVSSSLREGCLRALGSLCLNHDDSRRQLLEAKVLRYIVKALEDPSNGVRAAAALCVRALTRCVRTLRGGLLEGGGGEPAQLLVDMLADKDLEVQTNAAAAVCNLVLDFSAVKSAVLSAGGLTRLVELTRSPATPLRHHATWALANMLYRADNSVRVQLMEALPWSRLRQLLFDSDPRVVEQALVILRNLCMAGRQQVAAALEWADSDRGGGGGGGGGDSASVTGLCPSPSASPNQDQRPLPGAGDKEMPQIGILDVLEARIHAAVVAMSVDNTGSDSAPSSPLNLSPQSESAAAPAAAAATATAAVTAAAAAAAAILPVRTPAQYLQTVANANHALYAVANLLTGGTAVKDLVASRQPLLAAVAAHMYPWAGELALPAVWCAVNLTWPAGGGGGSSSGVDRLSRLEQEAVATRCNALLNVRGEERLEELSQKHPSRDVQERARTALEQLRSGAGRAGGAAATSPPAAAITALISVPFL
ncbi:hypothetical protein VaNZ11_016930, partial [Volvox africanus]